jgi:hypothetical protein
MVVVRYADDTVVGFEHRARACPLRKPAPAKAGGGGPNGFWRTCASGWRNSTWNCTLTKPG